MADIKVEKDYWNNCADDPNVDIKYISDMPDEECLEALEYDPKRTNALEVGCGVGRLLENLAEKHSLSNFTGIDISTKMLSLARKRRKKQTKNVTYKTSDGRTIPYKAKSFDFVYAVALLQHLDPETVAGYIKEIARVLSVSGVVRLQLVEGTYHSDAFEHHYTVDEIEEFLNNSGLNVTKLIEV